MLREEVEEHYNFVKSEFRYPNVSSSKKKWYITINCVKCGEMTQKIFTRSTWNFMCNACGKGRRTKEEFVKRATETHGDTYTYDNVVYTNNDTKVSVTCPTHGDWWVRPTDFISGGSCPRCSKLVISKKLENTKEQWQVLLRNKEITLEEKTSKDYGAFKCRLHGRFKARLKNAASSETSGCKVCERLLHRKQPVRQELVGTTANLYLVYLPRIDMFKIGCTVQQLEARFSGETIHVVDVVPLEYLEAIEIEHLIHTKNSHLRYKGSHMLLKEGNNELYHRILITPPKQTTILQGLIEWSREILRSQTTQE